MKTILVPTQHIAAMRSALETAVLLARRTGAYIEGFPLRIAIPPYVVAELTAGLERLVKEIESQNITYKGWATPGASLNSAALDVARATCRRAERRVCALREADQLQNPEILVYLNRLSDLLWLFARWVEAKQPSLGGAR